MEDSDKFNVKEGEFILIIRSALGGFSPTVCKESLTLILTYFFLDLGFFFRHERTAKDTPILSLPRTCVWCKWVSLVAKYRMKRTVIFVD